MANPWEVLLVARNQQNPPSDSKLVATFLIDSIFGAAFTAASHRTYEGTIEFAQGVTSGVAHGRDPCRGSPSGDRPDLESIATA
jgi:hypothetical protein